MAKWGLLRKIFFFPGKCTDIRCLSSMFAFKMAYISIGSKYPVSLLCSPSHCSWSKVTNHQHQHGAKSLGIELWGIELWGSYPINKADITILSLRVLFVPRKPEFLSFPAAVELSSLCLASSLIPTLHLSLHPASPYFPCPRMQVVATTAGAEVASLPMASLRDLWGRLWTGGTLVPQVSDCEGLGLLVISGVLCPS